MNEREYSYLKGKILKLANIDIDCYKEQQMRRRLDGFIARHSPQGVIAYCNTLERDRGRLHELLAFLTINVSEFWRDVAQFRMLKEVVLPQLLARSPRLNIWSAACSRGQEPYTIAIVLEELCPARRHRILATDIDQDALAYASAGGPYPPSDIKNVERHLLERYFVETDKGFSVADCIKKRVEFRHHNLLYDPFDEGFDLVLCRNAIIYFCDSVRDRLFAKFNRCLKEGGVLFVGGSEVMLRPGDIGFVHMMPSFYRKLHSVAEEAATAGAL